LNYRLWSIVVALTIGLVPACSVLGGDCTTKEFAPARFCSLARAAPGQSLTIQAEEGCTAGGDTRCEVFVKDRTIGIHLVNETCSSPIGASASVCTNRSIPCVIPPLEAGQYSIYAAKPADREVGALTIKSLTVTADGDLTTCRIAADPYPQLDAARYGTSCTTDADCIAVVSGDVCSASCANVAMSTAQSAAYQRDRLDLRAQACAAAPPPPPGGSCPDLRPSCGADQRCTMVPARTP
jgi:hypothetical protein